MNGELQFTTPALLFPAISLLFLAYTNRFLVLAQLIRQLHAGKREETQDAVRRQIRNLRKRISLINLMELLGVVSFVLCSVSMFCLFLGETVAGKWLFSTSLVSLTGSLVVSLYEIWISAGALEVLLEDMEK
jgi:hypothetical protein